VLEANPDSGRKLLLTGGRRCNLTHQIEPAELVRLLGKTGRFLSFGIYKYPPQYIQVFFAQAGLETRIEEDGCVFPATYKAQDVKNALLREAKIHNVKFHYNEPVSEILKESGMFLIKTEQQQIMAEKVIIATGGISWPQTGSTGDGYRFAKHFGHTIVEPRAALVPLVTSEKWPGELAGTSVANVRISTSLNKKKLVAQGAIVFTNDGLGGPAAQDMSRHLTDFLPAGEQPLGITLDLVPDSRQEKLEEQIIRLTNENPKKKIFNILADFLPKRLALVVCKLAGCNDDFPAGQIKKETRRKITQTIKALPLSIIRTRSIEEAIVTRGGVNLTEINPKTMESKICQGLFFAGEVIDADAPCGGYNLQICWSTGALAGSCVAKK
jgi:predicted Rossmann fold flavoprotein